MKRNQEEGRAEGHPRRPQPPRFKSQEEFKAFLAVQNGATADARIAAGSDFLASYPDSEAVALASYYVMLCYRDRDDFENMILYGEMVLAGGAPAAIEVGTLIALAVGILDGTGEWDFDQEEKLGKAEGFARRAMTLTRTLPKVNPNMTDHAWLQEKRQFMSQCHEAVGSVMTKREDYLATEESARRALDMAPDPQPDTMFLLATALSKQGKNEEAAVWADRCTAAGGVADAADDLGAQPNGGWVN